MTKLADKSEEYLKQLVDADKRRTRYTRIAKAIVLIGLLIILVFMFGDRNPN
jgi:hypothetical protein